MPSRWLASLFILTGLLVWFRPQRLIEQVGALDGRWLLVALAVGVVQVALSAWRWRFTAQCLGLLMPYRQALREYYLGTLINQVLPGGVLGDAYRAKRHADQSPHKGPAWLAVIIERFSGQLALAGVAVVVMVQAPAWRPVLDTIGQLAMDGVTRWGVALGVVAMTTVVGVAIKFTPGRALWGSVAGSLRQAFWPPHRAGLQLVSSLAIVTTYMAVFVLAAWSIGVDQPWPVLLAVAPALLLAMVVPVTVSGWGLRELVAAGVWSGLGLDPAQGVAVSVAYGVLIFLIAAPGLLMWRSVARARH
jgi:uncharacterized membrane protein YbhN (UPF0104 family)